jgi:hypothetical protein
MRLYIDKENILAFMSNRNSNNDLFEESIRLIKKGINVYYNFPKRDIRENQVLFAWFGKMNGAGVEFESTFCEEDNEVWPIRPLASNFYNRYNAEDRSSIYLLNIEENTRNVIRNKHSILIGYPGDEMELFDSLLKMNDREQLMCQIESWSNYCPKIPLTDVIICDNHYFKNINVYRRNDNELVRALAAIPKDTINLVFITKEGEVDREICLDDECRKIKELVARESGLSRGRCSVTILTTNRTHSRHIITNYYRIKPTSCVHLKDNGLRSDVDIDIKPHTNHSAIRTSRDLIKEFQKIADNPVRVFGDKKSNYIKFQP